MAGERTALSIPVSTNDRLLNLAEAATWLGMGQSTLRQALYEGRGPRAIKLPGSDRWRFRPSDLEAYVKAGEISPKQLWCPKPRAETGRRRECFPKMEEGRPRVERATAFRLSRRPKRSPTNLLPSASCSARSPA